MRDLKLKKKKKGFTLIELIVVIAILAILALIIVPKITGYVASANKAKVSADAKTVQEAIEAHNATATTTIDTTSTTINVSSLISVGDANINDVVGKLSGDTNVSTCTLNNLQNMSQAGQ